MIQTHQLIEALQKSHAIHVEFIIDINQSGGIQTTPKGASTLVTDPDWIDLAITAQKAHTAAVEIEQLLHDAGHPVPEAKRASSLIEFDLE